jgi:hypothetical protein
MVANPLFALIGKPAAAKDDLQNEAGKDKPGEEAAEAKAVTDGGDTKKVGAEAAKSSPEPASEVDGSKKEAASKTEAEEKEKKESASSAKSESAEKKSEPKECFERGLLECNKGGSESPVFSPTYFCENTYALSY